MNLRKDFISFTLLGNRSSHIQNHTIIRNDLIYRNIYIAAQNRYCKNSIHRCLIFGIFTTVPWRIHQRIFPRIRLREAGVMPSHEAKCSKGNLCSNSGELRRRCS